MTRTRTNLLTTTTGEPAPLVLLVLRVFPIVVILAVVVVTFATPPAIHIAPVLAVAPAFAGLSDRPPRSTLIIGAVAAAAAGLLSGLNEAPREGEPLATLVSIALVTLATWAGVHVRLRQQRTLEDVRSVAETAQQVLLRQVPRHLGELTVGVRYGAAAAEARIGGDLYEVVTTPFGVRALIGDVRGKGLPAVRTAAAVLGAFREAAYEEPELPGVVRRLANSMRRRLEEDVEEFVTLVLVNITDPVSAPGLAPFPRLEVVNCGHPPPLLLREGRVRALDPPSPVPPLGIVPPEAMDPPVLEVYLRAEDRVLLYTDGIVEARDAEGTFYPLTDRAADALPGVEATLDRIEEDVRRHVGRPLEDDAAMLLLRYSPYEGTPAAPRRSGAA